MNRPGKVIPASTVDSVCNYENELLKNNMRSSRNYVGNFKTRLKKIEQVMELKFG